MGRYLYLLWQILVELSEIYQDKMSIDKYQQSMENWKKEIIIDPHLNALFDAQISPQLFLKQKILTLAHPDIIKVYMKLTSLRHAITKNMQKEIEVCHPIIESSFQDSLQSKTQYERIDQDNIRDSLKQIQRFNEKYELISDRVTEIRNINKILHFAKALQKFKVNARLLKSLMKDFDQSSQSHFQSQLINTLKISKIIKEISAITIRFDFSGIKSYEEQRIFLNNTKGAMFGLIQKELAAALSKMPAVQPHRRADLQKDIINKFVILNNITKLKDFCIPFYKNTLKEMSELLKKSLVIGQSAEERDPSAYLQTFEEYFTNSLRRRLVENGIIFICFDELLSRSNIKTPFNFNFFEKYWQNISGFMKDLTTWSMDNDAKECAKEKLSQNLFESFELLQSKDYIPKYLTSITWKYPIIYEAMSSISNQVHLYILKYAQIHHYDFTTLKEKLFRVLLPLALLYYKNTNNFYSLNLEKARKLRLKLEQEQDFPQNFIESRILSLFDESKASQSFQQVIKIVRWMLAGLKTKQIYQHHVQALLQILDQLYISIKDTINRFDSQKHSRQSLTAFLDKYEACIAQVKAALNRGKVNKEQDFEPEFKTLEKSKGVLASDSQQLMRLVKRFRTYQALRKQGLKKLE